MRLSLLLLIFLLPQALTLMKMAKIFGKVQNPTTPKSFVLTTMKLCFDGCYNDSDCFLVEYHSSNTCSFYNFSTVQESLKVVKTEPESQMYVAFKTTLPEDTCPVSFEAINLTYIHPDGTAYPWKVLSDGFSFKRCQQGWKRFERRNGNTVCMKMMARIVGITKNQAEADCRASGALLIGVETLAEVDWMWDHLSTVSNNYSFWLDGVRIKRCRPSANTHEAKNAACDIFDWSNDLTTGSSLFFSGGKFLEMSYFVGGNIPEDCLVVAIDENLKRQLNDVPCTNYRNSNGMICGYKLD
ncbi:hypothetical protein CAEBREN_18635 [Caenorhabditis brenneri]|uniref:PAN-3 domain-containing protein n=1 Tax=Caenorhabditis brenneri TaxID=135651 RepID=G0NSR3_CAEBE|nr:hypothetical protein CAEBREN_18635 [Caenorhabditis brenneri]